MSGAANPEDLKSLPPERLEELFVGPATAEEWSSPEVRSARENEYYRQIFARKETIGGVKYGRWIVVATFPNGTRLAGAEPLAKGNAASWFAPDDPRVTLFQRREDAAAFARDHQMKTAQASLERVYPGLNKGRSTTKSDGVTL